MIKKIKIYNSLSPSNQNKFLQMIQDNKSSLNDILGLDPSDLKEYSKYTILNKYSFKKLNLLQEFESAIKTNNKLYIPGSSIKGYIKTALFFKEMQLNSIPKFIKKFRGEDGGDYWNIYNDIFTSKSNESSMSNSIMRFLQVTDSTLYDGNPHLYKVIRLYSPHKKAKYLKQMKIWNSFFETIPECDSLKTSIITNFDEEFFSDLNFNDNIIKLLDIKNIAHSLSLFSDFILDTEIKFFSKYEGRERIVKHYKKLCTYNYYNKPLILLGGGTGFHTKTMYLKILDYDEKNGTDYSVEFCDILFKNRNNYMFPKTRRLLYPGFRPLGWAQLDFTKHIS